MVYLRHRKRFYVILLSGLTTLAFYRVGLRFNRAQISSSCPPCRKEINNQAIPKLKSAIKKPSHSTQHNMLTSTESLQPALHHQQSHITTNTSIEINSYWQKKCVDITQLALNRIHYLQNPRNCSTARKVICGHAGAGMGSTVHHWVYCLIYAFYTNRTMIIDTSQWYYLKNVKSKDGVKDFHDLFKPISKCKYTNHDKKVAVNWNRPEIMDSSDTRSTPRVLRLETVGVLETNLKVAPTICHQAMPIEIFIKAMELKYKPMAWWIGQLAQYIIRPNKYLQQFIDQSKKKFQFQSPVVGLHIRRTDKYKESKLFNIDKYMAKVELFFNDLAKRKIKVKRQVFVTTDEPWLITHLKLNYTNYQFIHPPLQQLNASFNTTRYSAVHLKHFLRDVFLLAECDYLIVTMSSNVGRLAYELHETIYSRTRSKHYTSLDDEYYIHGHRRSIMGPWVLQAKKDCPSKVSNGISLIKGDFLDSCVWFDKKKTIYRGYSKRLKKSGSFPKSCVTYLIDIEAYPNYSKVDKSLHLNGLDQLSNQDLQNSCTKTSINDKQL